MMKSLKFSSAVIATSLALTGIAFVPAAYASTSHAHQHVAMSKMKSDNMMSQYLLNGRLFGNIPDVTIRGVAAAQAPWIVNGTVKLTSSELMASGKDLVVPKMGALSSGQPVPASTGGTTAGIMSVGAEITFANKKPIVIKSVPLNKQGNFSITAMVNIPKGAIDPVVLIGPVNNGKMSTWFASSNFLMDYGVSNQATMGSSDMKSDMGSSNMGSSDMGSSNMGTSNMNSSN